MSVKGQPNLIYLVYLKLSFEAYALPYVLFGSQCTVLWFKPETRRIHWNNFCNNSSFDLNKHFNVLTTKLHQQNI